MTIGQRIKSARKNVKKTQAELGLELGVSASMVAQWENSSRTPKMDTLKKIATALSLTSWTDLLPEEMHGSAIAADIIDRAGLTLTPTSNDLENADTENDPYTAVACAIPSIFHAGILAELDKLGISKEHITRESRRAAVIGEGFIVDWLTPAEAEKVAYSINEYFQQLISSNQNHSGTPVSAQKPPETDE